MRDTNINYHRILIVLAQVFVCLIAPLEIFGQTETLDIIRYTPPAGWTKSLKEGAVVYSDINKKTNGFCVLTIYSSTPSSGNAQKDFSNEWSELVVKPFKAEAHPKTETQTDPEGWKGIVGAAQIKTEGGLEGYAILTVFSGFGKTASILAILNDQSYLGKTDAFVAAVKLDKSKAAAGPGPTSRNNPTNQRDPFPDQPGRAPQKPLAGPLKTSITLDDLAGTWDEGGASVVSYVNSGTGSYSGTDTTFYAQNYAIRSDGTFTHSFQGRTSNHTVRELGSGIISLSGGYIIVKFTAGESRGQTYRYQFIAYMTLPNGGAVLSLFHVGDNQTGYDSESLKLVCGHAQGYITCGSGEEWLLRPAKSSK